MPDKTPIDDFDAAKKIVEELRSLPRESQERVLRWVSESIGVSIGAGSSVHIAPQSSPSGSAPAPQPAGPPVSSGRDIRSFVTEKAPTSDNQFAAVVAYYYRFEAPPAQRRDSISGADLQEAARLAGRKRLSNPRHTLKHAKNMGYLNNPGRGEYTINTVGENLVAMTLPGGAEAAPRNKRSAGRRSPRSAGKRSRTKSGKK